MNVVLTWSAGSVRVTPIAYEPPERTLAMVCTATTFPTWTSAVGFCSERNITVANRDQVQDAIDDESRSRHVA